MDAYLSIPASAVFNVCPPLFWGFVIAVLLFFAWAISQLLKKQYKRK